MPINFNNNFNNSGLLTNAQFFFANNINSKEDVANSILNGLGGNKEAGFDFKSIVDLSVSQKMGNRIESLKSDITNTNIRLDSISSMMSSYQEFQRNILDPFSLDSSLSGVSASSTNPQAANVSVRSDKSISPGTSHTVSIQNLAASESISSAYFAGEDALLGEGVFSLDLGSYTDGNFTSNGAGGGLTISIEEGMSLRDLANEINAQSRDINANIVRDDNGVRLALFSQKTGSDQSINISITADDNEYNSGIHSLAYSRNDADTMVLGSEARDAQYTVNGVSFTSKSNQINDLFGFDLVLRETTETPFNISTQSNNDGVIGNLEAFVYSYNQLIDQLSLYTDETPGEEGRGSLYRQDVVSDIERELFNLQRTMNQNAGDFLSIGVSFNADQSLNIDYRTLNAAMTADPNSVRNVFTDGLSSSNPNITVLEYGDDARNPLVGYTENGTYSVEVTQAATQALMQGDTVGSVVIGPEGHNFSMQVNGREIAVAFDEGEYASEQIASRLAEAISRQTGLDYRVLGEDGAISIMSNAYGSSQAVEIIEGGELFGLSGSSQGSNIQGRINGVVASGDGTTLTSILSNDSQGLSLNISGNQVGNIGDVTVSRGALSYFANSIERLAGENGLFFEALREYSAKLDKSNPESYVVGLEAAKEREENLRQQYNARFTASQQAIAVMNHNLMLIDAMFGPKEK